MNRHSELSFVRRALNKIGEFFVFIGSMLASAAKAVGRFLKNIAIATAGDQNSRKKRL